MRFDQYKTIIRSVPFTEGLAYIPAILWLNPDVLPLGVAAAREDVSGFVRIPDRVKNKSGKVVPVIAVSKHAFSGREDITDIVLPDMVQRLSGHCFAGCKGLKRITIPRRLKTIPEGAFEGCSSLEDIYYEGSMEEWGKINVVHEKHEVEFGDLIPGTPVSRIESESLIKIPGNEALLLANLHFHCRLDDLHCQKVMDRYLISLGTKTEDFAKVFETI